MSNAEQIEYWNGEAGKRWAQDDDTMARLLGPITEALLEHAAVEGSQHALDVGCGGGSQSLLLAQRLGTGARVLGVDISAPMLEVAAAKAETPAGGRAALQFTRADASEHDFGPDRFDLVFSRFGVMFFADPEGAFGNLRRAMLPGAKLAFCCWQPLKENAWTWIPLQAALQHLPPPEPWPSPKRWTPSGRPADHAARCTASPSCSKTTLNPLIRCPPRPVRWPWRKTSPSMIVSSLNDCAPLERSSWAKQI